MFLVPFATSSRRTAGSGTAWLVIQSFIEAKSKDGPHVPGVFHGSRLLFLIKKMNSIRDHSE